LVKRQPRIPKSSDCNPATGHGQLPPPGPGPITTAGSGRSATLRPDGRGLVAGGCSVAVTCAFSELFDPCDESLPAPADMLPLRALQAALTTADGRARLFGGQQGLDAHADTAAIYDPT